MNVSDLLLISVGNTRTRMARCYLSEREGSGVKGLQPSRVMENGEGAIVAVLEAAEALAAAGGVLVVASVNAGDSDQMIEAIQAMARPPTLVRLVSPGSDEAKARTPGTIAVPIALDLTPPVTVGVDRVLCALAAYRKGGEACVVIDAGTAMTVGFVDGFGVFRGGAIAPGLNMMLRALHEETDALPLVQLAAATEENLLGRTTVDAMRAGCIAAARGMAHLLIDHYAQANGSYPRVIATGGDAPRLFENDELVEHIVPDLVLMGMQIAFESATGAGDSAEAGTHEPGMGGRV